jgi:glutathione S-transferase
MSEITFYTNPMSRGQIARWMLEEVGVGYEQVIVEYGDEMKSDAYLSINPMGKVPAIKHGNSIVTECSAICAYLADVFPAAKLAPNDEQKADYYRWLFFAAGPLESAVTNNNLGFNTDDEQQRMAGYGNYALTVDAVDKLLSNRDYICGDSFTAADVYLGSHIDWGMAFGTLPERDSFVGYAERLRVRPAYVKAKAIDAALMPQS